MIKYIAFDNETGGTTVEHSLLQVYICALDENLNKVDDLTLWITPKDKIYRVTAEALDINGINLIRHDRCGMSETKAGTALYNKLNEWNPNGKNKLIPIGHNVTFDIIGICDKLMTQETWNKFVSYRKLDTGVVAQFLKSINLLPESVSGSLESLVTHFKVEKKSFHTAQGDTLMTVGVLKAMQELIVKHFQAMKAVSNFIKEQKPLDPEAAKILNDNLWDLYL